MSSWIKTSESRTITREQFKALNCVLVKRECTGYPSAMGMFCTDTYRAADGSIVVHEWEMGGETYTLYPAKQGAQ